MIRIDLVSVKKHIIILIFSYGTLLIFALLHPFDFDFGTNHAQWLAAENGIQFKKKGIVLSREAPVGLHRRLLRGSGFTLEAWVKTDDILQEGPARIVSYSIDTRSRNFTLGQSQDRLIMRLRTIRTDPNGLVPHLEVPQVFLGYEKKTYIVVTYDFKVLCLYIDGALRQCDHALNGDFANWDPGYQLVFGNEVTGNRPWLGEIYFVSIFDRAMGSREIAERFNGGVPAVECNDKDVGTSNSVALCFPFDKRAGKRVTGYENGVNVIQLHIPPARLAAEPSILRRHPRVELLRSVFDLANLFHILIFIPMGTFLHRFFGRFVDSPLLTVAAVIGVGFAVALGTEMLQQFLPSRTSTIIDVVANMLGLCLGIIISRFNMKWRDC
jgi:hypothetical protein